MSFLVTEELFEPKNEEEMEKKNSPWGLALSGLLFLVGTLLLVLSLSMQCNRVPTEEPAGMSTGTKR